MNNILYWLNGDPEWSSDEQMVAVAATYPQSNSFLYFLSIKKDYTADFCLTSLSDQIGIRSRNLLLQHKKCFGISWFNRITAKKQKSLITPVSSSLHVSWG